MSEDATPPLAAEPRSETEAPQTTAINDQVRDALRQVEGVLGGQAATFTAAVTLQALVQAVALGMHNAVAQQQHSHMLRTALTTAAARALLDGKREEAEAVLKLAESSLVNPDVGAELSRLQATLRSAVDEIRDLFGAGVVTDLKTTVKSFAGAAAAPGTL